MADRVSIASFGWSGITPANLSALTEADGPTLKKILIDPATPPARIGAAAFRLAAISWPVLCATPVAWRRWSPDRVGLMVNDARRSGWQLSLNLETISTPYGPRVHLLTEIVAGPFGTDPDGDQINPRDMTRKTVAVVAADHRVAA